VLSARGDATQHSTSRHPPAVSSLSELTTGHLHFLRPHFFEGGRWVSENGLLPVTLSLDRPAFTQVMSVVLSLPPQSLLEIFARACDSHGKGVTWHDMTVLIRQTVEASLTSNPTGYIAPPCTWAGGRHDVAVLSNVVRLNKGLFKMAFLKVIGARKLPATDQLRVSCNACAIVIWNGEKVYTTTTKFGTTQPRWDEHVMLRVPTGGDNQQQNTLCIEVWDQTVQRDSAMPAGVMLGRTLLLGGSLGRLMAGERKAAFRLESDGQESGLVAVQVLSTLSHHTQHSQPPNLRTEASLCCPGSPHGPQQPAGRAGVRVDYDGT
jgi:hypothetical protein